MKIDKKIWILLFVAFIDMLGFGIAIPILPLIVKDMGGNPLTVGMIIAVFSLFQFISSPILGRLSDKYGRKPILIISSLIYSLSYLILVLSKGIIPIFIARIAGGIASGNLSVGQAYIADVSRSHERTKLMAMFGSLFGIGFAVGPFLGGVLSSQSNPNLPFLITFIFSFVNFILISVFLQESSKNLQKHIKIEFFSFKIAKEVIRPQNLKFLFTLFFLINFATALTYGVFPFYSSKLFGWGQKEIGYYFGLGGLVMFISQGFFIRLLLQKFSEKRLIFYGILFSAVSLLMIGIAGSVAILLASTVIFNIGFSLVNPNIQGLVSLETLEEEQGIVLGTLQSFGSIARVAGPLIGGIIADFMINMPYIASSLVIFLIFIWGVKYLRKNSI